MGMVLFRLITSGLLPVLFAVGFYYAEKNTAFGKRSYMSKQIIIGIAYGCLAILSTEFGIPVSGVSMNVRDAAPLTAGLLFGGPAGIIAGVIGGVERWLSALWGVGVYSRLACSLATVLAGVLAALVRKFLLDNKKASWTYGLAVGVTMEVLHMLLIFITKMSDLQQGFYVVKTCALPMIVANGLSVMFAALFVSMMGKRKQRVANTKKIAQTFQLWLLVCVFVAFVISSIFTFVIQNKMAEADTEELLSINAQDVRNDILDASDENLLQLTWSIAENLAEPWSSERLEALAKEFEVAEINLIDEKGIIQYSTYPDFILYDMASGKQSSVFLELLNDKNEMVQDYQPTAFDESISRKYAGVALENGWVLQVGYDAVGFQKDIAQETVNAAKNRHIGQEGCVIICDENWLIVSDRDGYEGNNLLETGLYIHTDSMMENQVFVSKVYDTLSYCMYTTSEGFYIISVLPVEEAMFSRDASVYILVFMEILVFATLFAYIYFLIKKLIVENIQKVNATLGQITGGNLEVVVDVRSNEEFASLSDDINATVVTLKRYIDEAAARIDQELEFARSIQYSSLPSVFPPYPEHKEFEIYASMDTAKEVGGDFYDFYLLNDHKLVFLIADVSGKGIPAAMFMMTAKTLLSDLAESGLDVAQTFTTANQKLCDGNDANMFVTAWMGILNLKTGYLTYANAGHNPPLIRHKDGNFEYIRTKPNFILGGMDGVTYKKHELWLRPGDEIYLYTDGVTEAQDEQGKLYGEERLRSCLNKTNSLDVKAACEQVKADVDSFMVEADQFDDITMVMVKYHRQENDNVLELTPDKESVSDVSDFLDDLFGKMELSDKVFKKLKIATDEIYSNIVYYSQATKAEVMCFAEQGMLFLIFRDDGVEYNPLDTKEADIGASAEEREIGGLGVMIVRKLMDDVIYERKDNWNQLTMTLKIQ